MRSFPRLALSTVPVNVTFSPLSNSATRFRSSNWHSIVRALRDLQLWSATVPSSWTRGPGPLPGRPPPVCSMRDLTGFSSWPLVSAHASSLASGISGRPSAEGGPDFCLFLPVPACSCLFPPVPAWPMPRCYDRVFRFLYRRPAALFRKIAARAMVSSRLSRQDAEYRLEAFRLTMKPLPAS